MKNRCLTSVSILIALLTTGGFAADLSSKLADTAMRGDWATVGATWSKTRMPILLRLTSTAWPFRRATLKLSICSWRLGPT